jgi:hypothetical protein
MAVGLSSVCTGHALLPRNAVFLLWYSFLLEYEYTPWPRTAGRIRKIEKIKKNNNNNSPHQVFNP